MQVLGNGRYRTSSSAWAKASAEKNLTTVHAGYLTTGDGHAFLSKSPSIYTRSTTRPAVASTSLSGPKEGVLTTHEAETFSAPDCLTVVGWYRKALEMCGLKGVQVREEECRAKGGSVCRYRVRWE